MTKQEVNAAFAVRIIGRRIYECETYSEALQSLPTKHAFALVFEPGALNSALPKTQELTRSSVGIPASATMQIGDSVEVIHRGATQDSGGGKFSVVSRRRMVVVRFATEQTMQSGSAEDDSEFVSGGLRVFAVLGD